MMRTVQIALDEELLASVDEAARKLNMTRSTFTRKALREAMDHLRVRELERKHRLGYERRPPREDEYDTWEKG